MSLYEYYINSNIYNPERALLKMFYVSRFILLNTNWLIKKIGYIRTHFQKFGHFFVAKYLMA